MEIMIPRMMARKATRPLGFSPFGPLVALISSMRKVGKLVKTVNAGAPVRRTESSLGPDEVYHSGRRMVRRLLRG
jgi:hypothetical protein